MRQAWPAGSGYGVLQPSLVIILRARRLLCACLVIALASASSRTPPSLRR